MSEEPREKPSHFIRDAVVEDFQTGRFKGVVTRFPPEPNGYLHIGHANAIALDFGLVLAFGGRCLLRFDDTIPVKESQDYVDAITCDPWCIYPMYDWAHGQSDSIEGVTHSLCTLEYEDHRPLYDWYLDALGIYHPRQIEFARLNLSHTVMSKRRLLTLVEEGLVSGWDDPRMPTLAGLRRRGYTPEAIRDFCERIGIAKADNLVDVALLEHCVREDLNRRALRRMAVLRPLRLVIENYPEGQVEELEAVNNPEDSLAGTRKVPFSRVLCIEQDDFRDPPPPKYFRLSPGVEVRLRYAYIVKCTGVVRDAAGAVTEVRCTYDPASRGGDARGRKVKGTIHWVSASHSVPAEVRS